MLVDDCIRRREVMSTKIKVLSVNWEDRGRGDTLLWRVEEGFVEKVASQLSLEIQHLCRHSKWKDYHQ